MKDLDGFISKIESDLTFGVSDIAKRILGEFESVFGLVSATITEGLMSIVIDRGLNFWPVFEARRQQDQFRTKWFWADYLHYGHLRVPISFLDSIATYAQSQSDSMAYWSVELMVVKWDRSGKASQLGPMARDIPRAVTGQLSPRLWLTAYLSADKLLHQRRGVLNSRFPDVADGAGISKNLSHAGI